jgi:1-acyl-sn-glycerol-3-phosphate acyltransferase
VGLHSGLIAGTLGVIQSCEANVLTYLARNFLILLAKFLSGVTVRWFDCQPDTCQRVYFANHTSHLDPIVVWTSLPPHVREVTRMVAAKDYWEGGPIRRFIAKKVFNAMLIDRTNISIHRTPVVVMAEEMSEQYSIIIFPEGGRTHGDEVLDFKSGMYHLAKKRPDLEFIPVYLDNMNRILPRGNVLPVPMLSRIVFGPPIWIETGEKKDSFLARAREAVLRLKDL